MKLCRADWRLPAGQTLVKIINQLASALATLRRNYQASACASAIISLQMRAAENFFFSHSNQSTSRLSILWINRRPAPSLRQKAVCVFSTRGHFQRQLVKNDTEQIAALSNSSPLVPLVKLNTPAHPENKLNRSKCFSIDTSMDWDKFDCLKIYPIE